MNKNTLILKKVNRRGEIIKEWIELTLCELADDILAARDEQEIKNILSKYANEIYSAQHISKKNEKNT